jgi:hypothetical protein
MTTAQVQAAIELRDALHDKARRVVSNATKLYPVDATQAPAEVDYRKIVEQLNELYRQIGKYAHRLPPNLRKLAEKAELNLLGGSIDVIGLHIYTDRRAWSGEQEWSWSKAKEHFLARESDENDKEESWNRLLSGHQMKNAATSIEQLRTALDKFLGG